MTSAAPAKMLNAMAVVPAGVAAPTDATVVPALPEINAPRHDGAHTAKTLGVPYRSDLTDTVAAAVFLERVPIGYARRHGLFGFTITDEHPERIGLALASVKAWGCLDVLGRWLGKTIEPVFAPTEAITAAINHAYQARSVEADTLLDGIEAQRPEALLERLTEREDLLDDDGRAPVVKLVNALLFEAARVQASDVHIQPYEGKIVVRMRIDGVLFDTFEVPRSLHDEVVSRIKVMGRMNIAEKRLPQDGRATVRIGERIVDLRLSTVPTSHGERVVFRLLDKSARLYTLEELGMPPEVLNRFRGLIRSEHGLILVTGPTGSGKSTTLYGALQQINAKQLNVLTLEDPIEYQLEGISQMQVTDRKGMTFARGLRSVLRQDPDIIMVGEIRDHETAELAIQAALTGHLVFSTLHTNDSASAVTRLLDLGIEPYLVSSSLLGVMAQRLVRRVCPRCAQPVTDPEADLRRLISGHDHHKTDSLRVGTGCDDCRQTGYRGRVGIFELLIISDKIRGQIQHRASASEIQAGAVTDGMRTLRDGGLEKVLRGLTTVDEILRVTTRGEH